MIVDKLLRGRDVANLVREEVKLSIATHHVQPGLAVVLVGSRRDSQTYVNMKQKACEQVGIISTLHNLPDTCTQAEILQLVAQLNGDDGVHGILVQLPLPDHIDSNRILQSIDPAKDVDGLHPHNLGRLVMNLGRDCTKSHQLIACTPRGCLELLDRAGVELKGKKAVIVGRSDIVGKPMALLLLGRDCPVTICHSHTPDLPLELSTADIVVAALGKPNFIQGHWLKEGSIVLDVGINSVDDPSTKKGYRLVGDVDREAALDRVALITPVPGGVGPMTIAYLLQNTLSACLGQQHQ